MSSEEQDSIFDDAEEETQVLVAPKHVRPSSSSVNEDYSGKKMQKIKKGEDKCEVAMSVTHKPQFIYNKKNDKFVGEKQVALQVNQVENEQQEEQEKHENVYKD